MTILSTDKWYTLTELDENKFVLGMSKSSIRRLITHGRNGVCLRARKTSKGGHWRVQGQSVLDFLSKV